MADSDVTTCGCCGTVLDADNLAWDYLWPDELAALPVRQRDAILQFRSRTFVIADGYGAAIRVILPIRLDTGHTATLGVWLGIGGGPEADRIATAARAGGDAWVGCTFRGILLNAVAPWPKTYLAMATAVGPEDRKIARIVDTEQKTLRRVLTKTWPHNKVVQARQTQA